MSRVCYLGERKQTVERLGEQELSELVRMLIFFHRGDRTAQPQDDSPDSKDTEDSEDSKQSPGPLSDTKVTVTAQKDRLGVATDEQPQYDANEATKPLIALHSNIMKAFAVAKLLKKAGHPEFQRGEQRGVLTQGLVALHSRWRSHMTEWEHDLQALLRNYPSLRFLTVHQLHFAVLLLQRWTEFQASGAEADRVNKQMAFTKLHHQIMLVPRLFHLPCVVLETALEQLQPAQGELKHPGVTITTLGDLLGDLLRRSATELRKKVIREHRYMCVNVSDLPSNRMPQLLSVVLVHKHICLSYIYNFTLGLSMFTYNPQFSLLLNSHLTLLHTTKAVS